jgi:aspartate racemase
MKTIGLIGGLSWESTVEYYQIINREVNRRMGGKHFARIRMYSFDFDEIDKYNQVYDQAGIGKRVVEESLILEKTGVEVLLLCANTIHLFADEVRKNIQIPLIHIAEETGKVIHQKRINRVALLGTKYTMEGDFIKGKLHSEFGIDVNVPDSDSRRKINEIIYEELILGKFLDSSRQFLINVINHFENIEGVILGCTELPLIIKPEDTKKILFNTTEIHALAAVDYALK